jgi:uncharacterized membrane protein
VRPEPVIYTTAGFTVFISLIAIWRRAQVPEEDRFIISTAKVFHRYQQGLFGKFLSIMLVIAIIGSLGMLVYAIFAPGVEESFTEFYIAGLGEVGDYPAEFFITGGEVTSVRYGDNKPVNESSGRVILGIVNNEHRETSYHVSITIDNRPLEVYVNGDSDEITAPIILMHGEKWEQEIGFTPDTAGDKQRVELSLYKNGSPNPDRSLHFWIDVRQE